MRLEMTPWVYYLRLRKHKAYVTYGGVAQGYALTSGRLAGYYASVNTK